MQSSTQEEILSKEARAFSNYLIGEIPSDEEIGLYIKIHELQKFDLTKAEEVALRMSLNSPFLISIFDSGFSMIKPRGAYKKKLFVLLAILEASVFHYSKFFPKVSGNNFFLIFYYGCRAVLKALVGVVIVKLIFLRHGKV